MKLYVGVIEGGESLTDAELGAHVQLSSLAEEVKAMVEAAIEAAINERMWRMRALRGSSLFEGLTSKDLGYANSSPYSK